VQQCENALWFLLNVPGVTAAVRQAAADGVLPGNMQLGEPSTAARAGSEDVEGVSF
jgi:hypothetical protein